MLAVGAAASCGDEDLDFPGVALPTATVTPVETPTCLPSNDACDVASDCSSGACITDDGEDFFCQ